MTTLPTTPTNIPAPMPRSAPSAASAAGGASIDPVKLINRHKWLLLASGVVGGMVGTGLNYLLEEVYPVWKPIALFWCTPPIEDIVRSGGGNASETEMARFMQTQLKVMTSDNVLQRVVEDPNLQQSAKDWCAKFMRVNPATGEKVFNQVRALRWLKDDLSTRLLPGTTLIELAYSGHFKQDSTAIVGLVREKYMQVLASQGQQQQDDRTRSMQESLKRIDDEVKGLQTARRRSIEEGTAESVDQRVSANEQLLLNTNEELLKVEQDLTRALQRRDAIAQDVDRPEGFVGNAQLQETADRDPLVLDIKGRISRAEDELKAMLNKGMSREHREYKAMEARIAGAKQNLDEERTRLLHQLASAEKDQYEKEIAIFEAQKSALTQKKETVSRRQIELTQLQSIVKDTSAQIDNALKTRASTNDDLQKIITLSQLANSNRVVVYQPERVPAELTFPQLKFMIPLGILAGIGLVGGLTFLREIIDQRVKSPSDITLMPRVKLLGWIPDASEDPEGKGAAETAFRDRPRGIVAESYRQLRSSVSKRIDQMGHKTILVMSGMPGSGATSVASNLALAMAAADKKVLVIDCNFRRPSMHRVFGVQESPGVADVLGAAKPLDSAIQKSSTPNVDVLSVGSKELRVVERLAANAKGDLLARAKALYDVVIIDVAPAVVAGDGFALAHRVDASILVVRAMADKRGMVARIKNELGEARSEFMGVVVNGVRASIGGYMRGNIRAAAEYSKA
jgi:capsular exopolysaccharide synthesis family protein